MLKFSAMLIIKIKYQPTIQYEDNNIMTQKKFKSAQEYLAAYLDGFQMHFSESMAAIKDRNFNYLAASDRFAQLIGFKNAKQLLNKNDFSTAPEVARFAEIFRRQDTKILELGKGMLFLSVNQFATGDAGYIIEKKPIIFPPSGEVLGIRMIAHTVYIPNLLQLIMRTNNLEIKTIDSAIADKIIDRLTIKQRMVLFLYINRFSNGQISVVMTQIGHPMSVSRVNAHLAALREILGVKSKEQLIDKALQMNINTLVPKELFQPGIYEIKKSEIRLV